MREFQVEIMKTLGVKGTIDPKEEIRTRVDFLKSYLKQSGQKGFVLGISGGQDSTLAGKLAQIAVDELNEGRQKGDTFYEFTAVRLPYGVQNDEDDAQIALEFINPSRKLVFNIKNAVDAVSDTYKQSIYCELADYHKGNVKARLRMIAQYAIGGEDGLLVIGTDHAAEAVTGFFTKFGDGGADILPLSGLSKRQGKKLLKELGAPEKLYTKAPTADLLDNVPQQADETELDITYDQLDDYLEGKEVDIEVAEKIEQRYKVTQHKREQPVTPFDTWWK